MVPAWAQLLALYRNEGRFGLTLSFLIGAMRKPRGSVVAEDTTIPEFRALLESMRDQAVGCPVRILRCIWLEQPVAALDSQISVDEVPIASPSSAESRLFVAKRYLVGGPPTVDTVLTNLWPTFQQPIAEGRFSYFVDEETFGPFSPKDFAFIERAFGEENA
jgi:hypothetical protein